MPNIKIGNREIGEWEPCYIIAEIGINHNGDLSLMKQTIDKVKECGVNAVKFQVFKTEEFISDKTATYTYQLENKDFTESMYEMFKRYEFTIDEWKQIFDYCEKKDIERFITPQNPSDLDFILSFTNLPAIKVGSDDLTNLELLAYYATKKKPLIISAGMAYISEIEDAVNVIRKAGNDNLAVLHCVSSYPAESVEVNLRKIITIRDAFNVVVGFSDHTIGPFSAIGAVALGASIIEKHFTTDKELPGPDHWFSANPKEMKELVSAVRFIEEALGSQEIKPTLKELEMRKIARRSIVASKTIQKGEIIRREALEFKRPGTGLAPKFLKEIIGKKAKQDIQINDLITFEKLE